jgi:hypothetical protein
MLVPAAAQADSWYRSETFATGPSTIDSGLVPRAHGNAIGTWVNSVEDSAPATLHAQPVLRGAMPAPPVLLDTIVKADASVWPRQTPMSADIAPDGTAAVAWSAQEAGSRSRVKVARVNADGTKQETVSLCAFDGRPDLALSVNDRGGVLVVHSDGGTMRAVRVTSEGFVYPTELGPGDDDSEPVVGRTPDGGAWIAWTSPGDDVQVVRVDADGVITSGPSTIPTEASFLRLAVSPDGTKAFVGGVTSEDGYTEVAGARLAASGPVVTQQVGGARITRDGVAVLTPSFAIGNDGTVTVARSVIITGTSEVHSVVTRIGPGNATGVVTAEPFGPTGGSLPAVGAAPDGRVLLAWAATGVGATRLATRVIDPAGTLGPILDAGASSIPIAIGLGVRPASGLKPIVLDDGTVKLGVQQTDPPLQVSMRFMALDATAPTLSVNVPAEAQVGSAVAFSQDASDPRGLGAQTWDFGDGSGASGAAVSHIYGAPGTYTVKATAADTGGNVAEVTRQITIKPVPAAVVPPGVQLAPPPVLTKPVRQLAAARIKISKAVRTRRKVAVSGTIARSASGRVTIAYSVRISGALVTQRKTARITAGRWSATLTVPSSVLKARRAATVSITYTGDGDTRKGTARTTVVVAKPKRKAKRR